MARQAKGSPKNFRWTKPMERICLEILAEEARKGNRPSNTFKAVSLNRVASTISDKYQVECDIKHVENHLRTVKSTWQVICKFRGDSGFGWDDNLKMITCDSKTFDKAVTAHPRYEKLLNKKIDQYDEMALVVGKDMETRNFVRTFVDIVLEDVNEGSNRVSFVNEENDEEVNASSSVGTPKRKRKSIQESAGEGHNQFVGQQLGSSRQFRWTKPMERIFLEILAKEDRKGNKSSNTFRAASLNRVASTISDKFQVECDARHVENHLRTVKNTWQIICKIRGDNRFGWDNNLKMITCDSRTFDEAVTAHPNYERFLNKNIDMYDEMALVVGKDMTNRNLVITSGDIELADANEASNPINFVNEEDEEANTSSSAGTSKRKRKKIQDIGDDDHIRYVGEQLGNIAKALEKFTEDKIPHLYKEVMSMETEGFDDELLCVAFDFLGKNELEAKLFLAKSTKHRKNWLQKFTQSQRCCCNVVRN